MKKKNFILFVLLGLTMFLISNKVSAATKPILGYIECKYKVDTIYTYGDTEPTLMKNGIITFAYSGINFSSSYDVNDNLFTYVYDHYDDEDEPYLLSATSTWVRTSWFGFPNSDYGTGHTQDFEQMNGTFQKALGKNQDLSCPKYLMLNSTSDGLMQTYTPVFVNNESECTSCKVFGKLTTTAKKQVLYNGESDWNAIFNSDKCDGVKIKLYAEPDIASNVEANSSYSKAIFKADISYPNNSSFKAVDVELDDKEGGYSIEYIYNLLSNNRIDLITINDDKGKEKVMLNYSKKKYCSMSNVLLGLSYNCGSYDDIKDTIAHYNTQANNLGMEFVNFARENLEHSGDQSINNYPITYYRASDYSGYNDAEELKKILDELKLYAGTDSEKYGKILETVKEGTEFIKSKSDDLCTDAKAQAAASGGTLNMVLTSIDEWVDLLAESAGNLAKRLEELGDTEAAEEAEQIRDAYRDAAEQTRTYYEVNRNQLTGVDVNLSFKADCGIITPALKKWLIQALDIIKISALVLTLILGMFDFFRGVASGNADTMKKVWTSFSRRLIVVVILFLLPVLIEFILGTINIEGVISSDPLCGIK